MRIRLSVLLSLLYVASCHLTVPAMASNLALPTSGKDVNEFVPKGWRIFKQASGDLNGDGKPDTAAILCTLTDEPEGGYQDNDKRTSHRPLIVLLAGQDGKLHLACESEGAVMWGQTANELALLAVDLKINKGNLITSIGNGATSLSQWDSTYRFQQGRFQLIGMTETHGNCRENIFKTVDSNLNTSYEIDTSSKGLGKSTKSDKASFYFVRAGAVPKAPALESSPPLIPAIEEWQGMSVKLNRADNVALGKNLWQKPNDFSAELKGIVAGSDFYIVAKVTDKSPDMNVQVRLRGQNGKLVSPTKTIVSTEKDGELLAAQFAMKDLNALKDSDSVEHAKAASVQVIKSDAKGNPAIILSTSCDAEKHCGQIRLRKSPNLPTLANFDWTHRDD